MNIYNNVTGCLLINTPEEYKLMSDSYCCLFFTEINRVTSTPATTQTTRSLYSASDRSTLHATNSTDLYKHILNKTDTAPNATEIPEMIVTVSTTESTPNVTSLSLTTLTLLINITVASNNLLPIQRTDRYPLQRRTERGTVDHFYRIILLKLLSD